MTTTTTAQMIDGGLDTDEQVLAAMRQYKIEYAASAPPAWICSWFYAAWAHLRQRGWAVRELSAELGR